MSLFIDKAIAIETARGRPSGMLTISIVITVIAISQKLLRVLDENNYLSPWKSIKIIKWMTIQITTNMQTEMAYFYIYLVVLSNLASRAVFYSLIYRSSLFLLRARYVLSPTATTIAFP